MGGLSAGGGSSSSQSSSDSDTITRLAQLVATPGAYRGATPVDQTAYDNALNQLTANLDYTTKFAQPALQSSYAALDMLDDSMGISRPVEGSYDYAHNMQLADAAQQFNIAQGQTSGLDYTFQDTETPLDKYLLSRAAIGDPGGGLGTGQPLSPEEYAAYQFYVTNPLSGSSNFLQSNSGPVPKSFDKNGVTSGTQTGGITVPTYTGDVSGLYNFEENIANQTGANFIQGSAPGYQTPVQSLIRNGQFTNNYPNNIPVDPTVGFVGDPVAAQNEGPIQNLTLMPNTMQNYVTDWNNPVTLPGGDLQYQLAPNTPFANESAGWGQGYLQETSPGSGNYILQYAGPEGAVNPQMTNGKDMQANILQTLQGTPGYQTQLQQGLQSVQNAQAAQGMLRSGATLTGINNYAQNQAQSYFQNYQNQLAAMANGVDSNLGLISGNQSQLASGSSGLTQNLASQVTGNMLGASEQWSASPTTSESASASQSTSHSSNFSLGL